MSDTWSYVIGAAVTAGGLLFNQWRSDRRESRRLSDERRREVERWDRDRERERELWRREDKLRWLDRRQEVYKALLHAFEPWVSDVRSWSAVGLPHSTMDQDQAHKRYLEQRTFDFQESMAHVGSVLAEVALIGSDGVRTCAQGLMAQLFAVEMFRSGDVPPPEGQKHPIVEEVDRRYDRLLKRVRHDIAVASLADADAVVEPVRSTTFTPSDLAHGRNQSPTGTAG
ncbi:hypothetical protein Raf01_96650 [Rugosimonospora africana]|uniref:Uncharacterized protein n=1 Tax=Rugosimonospora africana TaxID=556532 RepID=A0A8J3VX53_9ACTN|nr:hypothetical protein Raf01_96650 [Rugosimonospora africana]